MTLTLPRTAAGFALFAALAAGCGTVASAYHAAPKPAAHAAPKPGAVAHKHHDSATVHPTAHPTTHRANPIPQGNGGDQDSDNNGGPSDGDGNI